ALVAPYATMAYDDPPDAMSELVTSTAKEVVDSGDPQDVEQTWRLLVALATIDALLGGEASIRSVEARDVEEAETARFDKQIGAGPSAAGTTSLVEKAGLPRLLSVAIEHGAIDQESNGTSVTLRSTPYALATFGTGHTDTAAHYRAGLFGACGDENALHP